MTTTHNLPACKFTDAGGINVWDGFNHGSQWNGWDNVSVTPETWEKMLAKWKAVKRASGGKYQPQVRVAPKKAPKKPAKGVKIDNEVDCIAKAYTALQKLDKGAQRRALNWLRDKFGVEV